MTEPRISYVPYDDMGPRLQAEMDRSAGPTPHQFTATYLLSM